MSEPSPGDERASESKEDCHENPYEDFLRRLREDPESYVHPQIRVGDDGSCFVVRGKEDVPPRTALFRLGHAWIQKHAFVDRSIERLADRLRDVIDVEEEKEGGQEVKEEVGEDGGGDSDGSEEGSEEDEDGGGSEEGSEEEDEDGGGSEDGSEDASEDASEEGSDEDEDEGSGSGDTGDSEDTNDEDHETYETKSSIEILPPPDDDLIVRDLKGSRIAVLLQQRSRRVHSHPTPLAMQHALCRCHGIAGDAPGSVQYAVYPGIDLIDHRTFAASFGSAETDKRAMQLTSGAFPLKDGDVVYHDYLSGRATCAITCADYGFVDLDDPLATVDNDTTMRVPLASSGVECLRRLADLGLAGRANVQEGQVRIAGKAGDFTQSGVSREWQALLQVAYPDRAQRLQVVVAVYIALRDRWTQERRACRRAIEGSAPGFSWLRRAIRNYLTVGDKCVEAVRLEMQRQQKALAADLEAVDEALRPKADQYTAVWATLQAAWRGRSTRRRLRDESRRELEALQRRLRRLRTV